MAQTILVVEDDPTQRRLLEALLARFGYEGISVSGGERAIELLLTPQNRIDLVLLDLVMPDLGGLEVLERIRPHRPHLPVVVLTAHGGVDMVVKAMRAGASDFVVKPANPERLQVSIENALKLGVLSGELSRLTRRMAGELKFGDMIAASSGMRRVVDLARRAAASTIPVLIEGESGVGKELVARAIQGSSERAGKPLVTVNCSAMPENLVESILFGHERGAFTGAVDRHVGKFQEANGGTLFLDEIGELQPHIQAKLLRALQQGEIEPVGAGQPIKVDIRLISATNRDLAEMVRTGSFREDLCYRLNVFSIVVPPLRERRDDIAPLLEHFVAAFAASESKALRRVSPEAMQLLTAYNWPGNVRQLENAVFRAVVLCEGDVLTPGDFPQIAQAMGVQQNGGGGRRDGAVSVLDNGGGVRRLAEVEGDMIRLALRQYRGQMSEVARRLGIGRSTLYRKVRDLGIEVREPA
ncbi:MAG TPA: sigma-54 dependent transcriptional regulator [Candidatus Sulfotelmatobacter sp.]|nr:sigma-54 dependent transcriptional regulator [Candidatus Sulfotelmatobacter sp.]